jgi:exodeoxyribonuclease V alpha subunit
MPDIYGLLEKIIYYNEENDFIVAKLQEKGKKELTTIVGNISGINPGESLRLSGGWVHKRRFGDQFQVESFEVIMPATLHGIQKYLSSGLIKGIGPIMAERIVQKFGLYTLEGSKRNPRDFLTLKGLALKELP